jgi:hypothetical protein
VRKKHTAGRWRWEGQANCFELSLKPIISIMQNLSTVLLAAVDSGTGVNLGRKFCDSSFVPSVHSYCILCRKEGKSEKLLLTVYDFYEKEERDAHGQVTENCRKQKKVEQANEEKKSIGGCETGKIRKGLGMISKSRKCT